MMVKRGARVPPGAIPRLATCRLRRRISRLNGTVGGVIKLFNPSSI